MRVLVGCEFSGIVSDAFRRRGHEAVSCDLLPSEMWNQGGAFHIQADLHTIDMSGYDMGIFFPPCTHLCVSGARWFREKQQEQKDALDFVRWIMDLPIERIAIENPVGVISTRIKKPTQIIQPWQFGHEESKKTCLWLKNLPPLKPTKIMQFRGRNLTPSGQNNIGPSPDRWKLRSRTYEGIAEAMAEQWGGVGRLKEERQLTISSFDR